MTRSTSDERKLVPNRPTPEGRELGAGLARFFVMELAKARVRFPKAKDDRCTTCAFRLGTIPNGCPETLMDAFKCVFEVREFLCHERLNEKREPFIPCAGWLTMLGGVKEPRKVPWPFSNEPEKEEEAG